MSTEATTSFAALPGVDLIIRSEDNVHFPVHRAIIGLASPIFQDMLSVPQPSQGTANHSEDDFYNGFPLVRVTETQKIMQYMLSFCYSAFLKDGLEEWTELKEAIEILKAAQKYEMEPLMRHIGSRLIHLAEITPRLTISVFAVACCFSMKETVHQAARLALRDEINCLWQVTDEHRLMSADAFAKLLAYHDACAIEAQKVVTNLGWMREVVPQQFDESNPERYVWFRCGSYHCAHGTRHTANIGLQSIRNVAQWWLQYMDRLKQILGSRPSPSVVGNASIVVAEVASLTRKLQCEICLPSLHEDLWRFNSILEGVVNEAVWGMQVR